MNLGEDFILIAGTPGTGKSAYATHLQERHGYHYVEADNEMTQSDEFITEIHPPKSDYVSERGSKHGRFVLEFGFPPQQAFLQDILSLKSQGARLVWFSANVELAQQHFSKAKGADSNKMEAFHVQTNAIKSMGLPTLDFIVVEMFHGTRHLSNREVDALIAPRGQCDKGVIGKEGSSDNRVGNLWGDWSSRDFLPTPKDEVEPS